MTKNLKKHRRTIKEIIRSHKQYKRIYKAVKALNILKKHNDEIDTLYCVYVLNAHSKGKITDREADILKEWLHND